jgi:hypothetical protein
MGQATCYSMAHAHCMLDTYTTNIYCSCVIRIDFPLQQWLHERPSVLRYTYIAYLVISRIQEISFYKNINKIFCTIFHENAPPLVKSFIVV